MKAHLCALLALLVSGFLAGCGGPPAAADPAAAAVVDPSVAPASAPASAQQPAPARHPLARQNQPLNRYGDSNYPGVQPSQPLREIVNLPATIAEDLRTLSRRAVAAGDRAADTSTDGLRVKYVTGTNHSCHGLVENAASQSPTRPGKGTDFAEHCHDRDGRLVKSIANNADGTRELESVFLYEGGRPSAMLTYAEGKYSFGDFGLYRDGRLCLVARALPDGRIISCEVIFHLGEAEDYYARYAARRTDKPFSVADLYLAGLFLRGSSNLDFNETGELTGILLYPRHIKE
jgi:hypothetical protein